jgi:hypothetical protein
MSAPRALALIIAVAFSACTIPPTLSPSPSGPAAEPSTTALPSPSSVLVPLPLTSPVVDLDLADALRIAPPYELERPSSSDLVNLSGQIQGLPFDLAKSAGAGYAPSDFPMGLRFVRDGGDLVGVVVLVVMPEEVAARPGLLESIAAAAAAEANARLSYETIHGVKVGIVRGPIASTLAMLNGRLVFAQTGLPAVDPKDLITAVIATNDE